MNFRSLKWTSLSLAAGVPAVMVLLASMPGTGSFDEAQTRPCRGWRSRGFFRLGAH